MKQKVFSILSLLLMAATGAWADTKIIYEDDFSDQNATMPNWASSQDNVMSLVEDANGNYLQLGDVNRNLNKTRFSSFWGTTPWQNVTIGEDGYIMQMSFRFEQFGNNSGNAAQRNNEIAILSASATVTNDLVTNDFLFKMTQITGENGVVSNGSCGFYINGKTNTEIRVASKTWYTLTLNVVGQTVYYSIADADEIPLASGSSTLAEEADNRVGGIQHIQARYKGVTWIGRDIQISMETDESVANKPKVSLYKAEGFNRIYLAKFHEGETLNYEVPGGEETSVDYNSAVGEDDEPGNALITATQSGTLWVWTTNGDAISDKVAVDVECSPSAVGVTLDKTTASLSIEETLTLTPTFQDSNSGNNPTDKTVTWTTSDPAVATVANGLVTAVAAGTATITATATNGSVSTSDDVTATCTVTVAVPATYKIVMKKGTADSASWAATPNPAEEGKTVTLKYDGVMKVKSVKAVKKAALSLTSLAESTQGMIVGSDGNAYDVSDKDNLPSGVTAVAMVAYKSETAGESLAIALADEGYMNWSTAVATCEAKTEVKGGSWRLPSMDDWKNMTVGNDTDGYNYINLNTALTTAGGSKLNDDGYNSSFYWTSTENGGNAYQAYFYGDAQDMSFTDYAKTDSGSVRPVLAF